MANSAKRKGDRAELEVQGILRDLLGVPARRMLGAGRLDDIGDIDGLPDTVIQVTAADRAADALAKIAETVTQQQRAGALFGATWWRRRGGGHVVMLTPEQFATLWREAQPIANARAGEEALRTA